MPEMPKLASPDLSEDDKKFLDSKPWLRLTFLIMRLLLVPAMLAGLTAYFQYRATHNDKKTEAAYKTVAPAIDENQQQLKALNDKVELLQKLVLVMAQNGTTKPETVEHPTGPARQPPLERIRMLRTAARARKDVIAEACLSELIRRLHDGDGDPEALATLAMQCGGTEAASKAPAKAKLVEQLQQAPAPKAQPKPLPKSANDALLQLSP